jgi:hypothetical protein
MFAFDDGPMIHKCIHSQSLLSWAGETARVLSDAITTDGQKNACVVVVEGIHPEKENNIDKIEFGLTEIGSFSVADLAQSF